MLALAGGLALACVMFWPLPLHLDSQIPRELADPLLQAWQVAWGGHALAHQPLDYFQANIFYPQANSLAFSDALIGYAPAGLIGNGVHAAVARYNLLFLFAYGLAFAGTYLLARELGLARWAAVLAGLAFAFAPWRLEQDNHLHVLSSGGIPLSLACLLRGWRQRRAGLVFLGFVVAAWQVSIGFTLGLPFLYLLALGVAGVAVIWVRRGRPALDRRLVAAVVAGGLVLVAVSGTLATPYLQVLEDHPESKRTLDDLRKYSPPMSAFAVAPAENLGWGPITAPLRDRFTVANEKTLFPGLAILALALAGVAFAPWSRRVRLGLAAGVVVVAVFSLGVRFLGGHVTYRLLYEYAPGWEGIRTPGRLNTLTSLGLALLAGGGASAVAARVRGRRLAAALPALLCLAVLVEGSGFAVGKEGRGALAGPIAKTVPDPPPGQVGLGGPRLHLPVRTYLRSFPYMLWTTDDFAPIVNGISGFPPRFLDRLSRRVEGFPSRASVDYLRGIGVRYVVLHPDDVARTPWRNWRRRPVRGLGVRRRQTGGVVVYDLGRRSKSQTRLPPLE